ncbi:MAG: hypothetical protein PVI75_06670 [Gammaproteobacteria bacterium]|jgi:ankyrin repeat protein
MFKRKRLPYRCQIAQAIHTYIVNYIRGNEKKCEVTSILHKNKNNIEALKQLSKSGDSHLGDILHLPFVILSKNRNQALEKSNFLFKLFIDDIENLNIIKYWFLHKTKKGFMPIHDLLRYGSTENLRLYFKKIDILKQEKIINISEYKSLVFGTDKDNFSPLHAGIKEAKTTDIECIKIYLKKIDDLLKSESKEKQYSKLYVKLLTKPNKSGVTAYQQCLITGKKEILELFFARINSLHIKNGQRKKIYLSKNESNFSCMHSAAKAGYYFLSRHLRVLSMGLNNKKITKPEYKEQLIGKNSFGDTPLHLLLEAGNAKCLNLYFQELDRARKSSIISNDEYLKYVFATNNKLFNTIHKAVLSNKPYIVKTLIERIYRCANINRIRSKIKPNKFYFILCPNFMLYPDNILIDLDTEKNKQSISIKYINELSGGDNKVLLAVIKDKLWDVVKKDPGDKLCKKIAKCVEKIIAREKFKLKKINKLLSNALYQENKFGHYPKPKKKDLNAIIINKYLTKLKKSFAVSDTLLTSKTTPKFHW